MKCLHENKKMLAADQLPGPALSGAISEDAADELASGVAPAAALEQDEPKPVVHHLRHDELPAEMSMEWYANDLWSPAYRGSLLDFHGRLADKSSEEDANGQLSRDQ